LTVDDAWAAFAVMAEADAEEPYSRPIALTPLGTLPAFRIGVPSRKTREFFGDSEAEQAFKNSLKHLKALGAKPIEIDFTALRETAELVYGGPWVAERYQAIRAFIEEKPGALYPLTRTIIEGASRLSAADAFAGLYKLAELWRRTEPIWREVDMLAVPSIPTVYTKDQVEQDPIAVNSRLGIYTNFVNLLDLCALAVPSKFRGDGRPAGVTLIAPRGRDGFLASFGRLLHNAAGISVGASKIAPQYQDLKPTLPAGWIEIVAIGAHMSGLPLNHELQAEGAIFLRKIKTAPDYRLFALPGGATPRPGLLRCATGQGAQIACEVWALPADGFGRFVARIPSPLGIGTINLEDGAKTKGFLVEAEAVREGEDISRFGGWRAFLSAAENV
jgi:allophanate hydrolase